MTQPHVASSTPDDVRYLAANLRPADLAELQASVSLPPEEALMAGLGGDACLTWFSPEGTPVVIGGVVPTDDPLTGGIWLMATPEIERLRFTFLRNVGAYVDALHALYPNLYNCVDARNTLHIRWLRWMGFSFLRRIEQYGVEQRPFYEFVRIKHV